MIYLIAYLVTVFVALVTFHKVSDNSFDSQEIFLFALFWPVLVVGVICAAFSSLASWVAEKLP